MRAGELQTLLLQEEQAKQPAPAESEPAPEPEPESEPLMPEPEVVEHEPEEGEVSPVLAQYGLEDASPEELQALASELGGRLGPRIQELTARAREAEAALQAEMEKESPFQTKPSANNPYKDVSDREELETTYQSALETIRTGREALEDNEDAASDEVILTLGDRSITKLEVRKMVRRAEEARDQHLPARLKELQADQQREKTREAWDAKTLEDHPWLSEEGNELRAAFEADVPAALELIRKGAPELYPQAKWILANHVAWVAQSQGKLATQKEEPPKAAAPKMRPPASLSGGAAPSGRPSPQSKAVKAAEEQFLSTGTRKDLERFLAAKSQTR